MKHIKPINKKAVKLSKQKPDVFAYSPLPMDCSSGFWPGIEVHAPDEDDPVTTSSTDMNVSTQGLCSPFVKDTQACVCYWPAHDPDVDKIQQTAAGYQVWYSDCLNIYKDWQNLRFIYDKPLPPAQKGGADAWDKVNQSDLNEIYIADNWADTQTTQTHHEGEEPSPGNPWESPDIFVRYHDEPTSNFPNPNTDYHQGNPIVNQKNFLYARIRNIGQHPIDHVYVKFYAYGLSTFPGWKLAGHAMLRDINPGVVKVVKSVKPWIPDQPGHGCVMVIIDSTQDPVKLLNTGANFSGYGEKAGPQPDNVNVQNDNNVAQRNMTAVLLIPGWSIIHIPFEIGPFRPIPVPPGPWPRWFTIEAERPSLPREVDVSLNLPAPFAETARVPQRLSVKEKITSLKIPSLRDAPVNASLSIAVPASITAGEVHRIVVRQKMDKAVLGGITVSVWVLAPQNVRFIGNVETKEAHLSFCPEVRELRDEKKRAFFSLNDARSWGYKIHKECTAGLH